MTVRIFAEKSFHSMLDTPSKSDYNICNSCKRVSPSGKAAASQVAIRGFESHHPLIFT